MAGVLDADSGLADKRLLLLHLVAADHFNHRTPAGPVAANLRQIQSLCAPNGGVVQLFNAEPGPKTPGAMQHESGVPGKRRTARSRGIVISHPEKMQISGLQQTGGR